MKKIKFLLIAIAILGLSYTACEDMDIADIGIEKIEESAAENSTDTTNTTTLPPVFVAVGGSDTTGKIYYSYNGTEWISANFTGSKMHDVIYDDNNKIFVAVGKDGEIWTSSGGVTWTEQISNATNNLYRITAGDNILVAVGDHAVGYGHTIRSSSDGITWTDRNYDGMGSSPLAGIAFHGTKFFTMEINDPAEMNLYSASTTNVLSKNWSDTGGKFTGPGYTINNLFSINGQLLIVVGTPVNGRIYYTNDVTNLSDSIDFGSSMENVMGVIYDGTRYIAVGVDMSSAGIISTSSDTNIIKSENTWSFPTIDDPILVAGSSFNDIAHGGSNILIAVGIDMSSEGIIYSSSDNGVTFSGVETEMIFEPLLAITYKKN